MKKFNLIIDGSCEQSKYMAFKNINYIIVIENKINHIFIENIQYYKL